MVRHLRALLAVLMLVPGAVAAADFITLASTTSTENSGLFANILPRFTEATGIEVRVVAQGTGQALETARRGDADAVLVHARAAEDAFVAEGEGIDRRDVMHNDFVLVGPSADPAKIAGAENAVDAMTRIAEAEVDFASRGDDSGTHKAELALWQQAGIAPEGGWYKSTGSGMGATLNIAAQLPAYALTDRGTWISFKNRGDLKILYEGDRPLNNPYGVILVNPERHPNVKVREARAFADWLTGPEGQQAIADFRIDGQQLFFPDAMPELTPTP